MDFPLFRPLLDIAVSIRKSQCGLPAIYDAGGLPSSNGCPDLVGYLGRADLYLTGIRW